MGDGDDDRYDDHCGDGAILDNENGWTIRPGANALFVPVDFKY